MSHRLEEIIALERGDVELEIFASSEDRSHAGMTIWEIQSATLLGNMTDLDPDLIYNEIVEQGKLDALDQLIDRRLRDRDDN